VISPPLTPLRQWHTGAPIRSPAIRQLHSGAANMIATAGATIEDLGPWFGALRFSLFRTAAADRGQQR